MLGGAKGGLEHLDLLLNEAVESVMVGGRDDVLGLLALQVLFKFFQCERWSIAGVEGSCVPY